MSERPILMSAPMVRAVLDGSKSQTRRVITWPKGYEVDQAAMERLAERKDALLLSRCPYGVAGGELWVRETHYVWVAGMLDGSGMHIDYRATNPDAPCSWTPSIHMPRWASRISLKITGVRVEQLHDISADDAAAEGWPGPDETGTILSSYPIGWYAHLWDKINARRAPWSSNPWVWVIGFQVVAAKQSVE